MAADVVAQYQISARIKAILLLNNAQQPFMSSDSSSSFSFSVLINNEEIEEYLLHSGT
jgi:hypothetical protein